VRSEVALPLRKHFDVESAAAYLGISKAYLEYYLEEGMLRHALDMHESQQTLVVYLRDLPDETRDNILGLRGQNPDLGKLWTIKLAAKVPRHACPEFLYVTNQQMALFQISEEFGSKEDQRCFLLSDLDREPLTLWRDGRLHAEWLWKLTGSTLAGISVTREELDRLSSLPEDSESAPTIEPETKAEEPERFQGPFVEPSKKTNDTAITMVTYGNRYFKEKNEIPTLDQFIVYLIDHGSEIDFRRLNPEKNTNKGDREYWLNGEVVKYRSLKYRFNTYLRSDNDQN